MGKSPMIFKICEWACKSQGEVVNIRGNRGCKKDYCSHSAESLVKSSPGKNSAGKCVGYRVHRGCGVF